MSTEAAIARLGPFAEKHALTLETAMIAGGIVTPLEKAHFIAQMAHETSGFKRFTENLGYSADRLAIVFPKYFPTAALRRAYEYKPEQIANRVYANRFGNGNEASGDGWKYRGRGFTHLTFKDNYHDASEAVFGDHRLLDYPALAAEPEEAAKIAVWYWNKKKAALLARLDDVEGVTRKINGGLNGLDDRKIWLNKAKRAFSV